MTDRQTTCREILRLIQGVADTPIVGRAEAVLRDLIESLIDPAVEAVSESSLNWAFAAGSAGIGMLAEGVIGYDITALREEYMLSAAKQEACEAIIDLLPTVDEEVLRDFVDSVLRIDAHVSSEGARAELYDAAGTAFGAALRRPDGWWDTSSLPGSPPGWWEMSR